MKGWRIVLGVAGVALALFGCFRLVTQLPVATVVAIAMWLVAALIIHDGILSPAVVAVGWLLRTHVADRGRRYLQTALIVTGLTTVIALPMIYLRGSQPDVKALLLRDYGANLILIVGGVVVVSLLLYAIRVARDRGAPPGPVTDGVPQSGSDQR